jgi:peptidoglycan hydrolase-like protein with peptidoglycan-binding domain
VFLVVLAALAVAAVIFSTAKASLTPDGVGLAKITLPTGGGTIQSVDVVAGPSQTPVPVKVQGDPVVIPAKQVPAGTKLDIQVVIKRPGWISWLSGKTQRLNLVVTAPTASLRSHFVTVSKSSGVRLHFKAPISEYNYGSSPSQLHHEVLNQPSATITLPRSAPAGSVYVSAAPRSWETSHTSVVSWFPAGSGASAVANPTPGTQIKSGTPITLTFSKPVGKVLGSDLPPVSPDTQGTWHKLNNHTIQFVPQGYGYGLGATVKIGLPSAVHLVGGRSGGGADGGSWTVPGGTTTRLQQLLAMLGYLPMNFKYASGSAGAGVALTPVAQEEAAVKAPAGKFSWRYPNTPGWLTGDWQTGTYGEVTKAAVMAFENTNDMTADGVDGPAVWKALINAVVKGQRNTFGYTVVDVSEGSPESESTWHDGKTVVTGPVNTGVPAMATATGTFAVFEHLPVTTMSGTNADGSHYVDPGIPDVSYFNGGDALHGFIRASYGFPQSDGCVEMPYSEAASVYPYTPIGTIVHVT